MRQEIALQLKEILKGVSELGKILINKPLPCFSYKAVNNSLKWGPSIDFFLEGWSDKRPESIKGQQVTVSISGDAIIGFWCLWSAIAETRRKQEGLVNQLKKSPSPVIKAISDIIEARMRRITPDEALQSIRKFNPPQDALHFVERWINNEISFVHPPKPGEGGKE